MFATISATPEVVEVRVGNIVGPFPVPFYAVDDINALMPTVSKLIRAIVVPERAVIVVDTLVVGPDPVLLATSPNFLGALTY